jgi:hypothetical protein
VPSSILKNNRISLVVAHRETIRKLVGSKISTPYCCMGIYDYCDNPNKVSNSTGTKFQFVETRTREGIVIR